MTKITVILPTNRVNTPENIAKLHKIAGICEKNTVFNADFTENTLKYVKNASNIIEITLSSLFSQDFDNFEVILCHKYPKKVEKVVKMYEKEGFYVNLVKEKPSIWHKLGDFPTVNNIRNTGIIYSKGELLLFLDDYTIFSPNLLKKAWNEYQKGYYITARGRRRIRYNPEAEPLETPTRRTLVDKGVYSSYNFNNIEEGDRIPNPATWTYCCSVSLEDCLKINGFDEIYDGNFGGTDQDFGRRLAKVSNKKRRLMGEIYEFAHKSPRHKIRIDEVMRDVFGQSPNPKYIRANSWKPNKKDIIRYKRWHERVKGDLNPLWNKFMDIPLYNISDMR